MNPSAEASISVPAAGEAVTGRVLEVDPRCARFLSALSHELRTPLGSILMMSELLASSEIEPSAAQKAATLRTAAHDMRALISEVAQLARILGGRVRLEAAEVSVEGLVHELAKQALEVAPAGRSIALAPAPPTAPTLHTDRERLLAVVGTLIGCLAPSSAQASPIRVTLIWPAPGSFRIEITDPATTHTAAEIATLFEPFHAPSQRTRRAHGGQSLKLTIARAITTLLGGELRGEQRADGMTFVLDLPRTGPVSTAAGSPCETETSPARPIA